MDHLHDPREIAKNHRLFQPGTLSESDYADIQRLVKSTRVPNRKGYSDPIVAALFIAHPRNTRIAQIVADHTGRDLRTVMVQASGYWERWASREIGNCRTVDDMIALLPAWDPADNRRRMQLTRAEATIVSRVMALDPTRVEEVAKRMGKPKMAVLWAYVRVAEGKLQPVTDRRHVMVQASENIRAKDALSASRPLGTFAAPRRNGLSITVLVSRDGLIQKVLVSDGMETKEAPHSVVVV